ncbi:MAG TPA: PilW family protein [Methylotenera sp.]|nr:PilW family protein [Methylotenera sp.]HPV44208.1 PilW family protein [Methylotenera sp.]
MKKITQTLRYQSGFTIVELMVGLVIGLIASLVIMQTFSAFEGSKRSTTGIADAQTNGSIGLYMLQRELQFAGYGIPVISGTMPQINVRPDQLTFQDYTNKTQAEIDAAYATALANYNTKIAADTATVQSGEVYSALKCNPAPTLALDVDNDPATADVTIDVITPVVITEGVSSDTIAIRYGTTTRGGMQTRVVSPFGTDTVTVENNMGCRAGDVVLVTRNSNSGDTTCVATKVTSTNAQLDAAPNSILVVSNAGMALNNRLACLGQVRQMTFAVNGNQLQKNGQNVIGDIVSLQAQYGIAATANSEIVNQWVDASGGTWAAPTVANRNRIKAVRIALVARNNLLERNVVSQACTGAATGPGRVCVFGGDINLAATDVGADWNRYRYRTYEVIVPLRNVLAASPQL